MNRIYHPYWKWEDWQNGMWRKVEPEKEKLLLPEIIAFTGDHIKYGEAMMQVVFDWPNTMEHNLTNSSINQRAFVGHCACSNKHDWPEYLVRLAWRKLTSKQQSLANEQADKAIKKWRSEKNRELRQKVGEQMLF